MQEDNHERFVRDLLIKNFEGVQKFIQKDKFPNKNGKLFNFRSGPLNADYCDCETYAELTTEYDYNLTPLSTVLVNEEKRLEQKGQTFRIAKLLIENGCTIHDFTDGNEKHDVTGWCPFFRSAVMHYTDVFVYLIRNVHMDYRSRVMITRKCLDYLCSFSGWDDKDAHEFCILLIDLLIDMGASLNYVQPDNWGHESYPPPLHGAAKNGSVKVVRYLLKHGADPNYLNFQCRTLIDLSVVYDDSNDRQFAKNCDEIFTMLVDHGVDPNVNCSRFDQSPVAFFIKHSKMDHLKKLFCAGKIDSVKSDALDRCVSYNRREAFDLLIGPEEYDVSLPNSFLHTACRDNPAFIPFLMERLPKLDPDGVNGDGVTPIFWASDIEGFRAIVSAGGNVNAVNSGGNTPLMNFIATIYGRDEIVQSVQYLAQKTDMRVRNRDGQTAYDMLMCVPGCNKLKKWMKNSVVNTCKEHAKHNIDNYNQRIAPAIMARKGGSRRNVLLRSRDVENYLTNLYLKEYITQ